MTIILPGGLGALKAGPPPPSTWDPAQTSSYALLSNGNLTVTGNTGTAGLTRGVHGLNAGLHYFEITIAATNNDALTAYGICNPNFVIANGNRIGIDAALNSGGVQIGQNGVLYFGGTAQVTGNTARASSVIGVAANLTTGNAYFALDNIWIGVDPTSAAGYVYWTPPMTWFPAASVLSSNTGILNVGSTAFTYPLPTGYTAWG
jgi:hypothetical protein